MGAVTTTPGGNAPAASGKTDTWLDAPIAATAYGNKDANLLAKLNSLRTFVKANGHPEVVAQFTASHSLGADFNGISLVKAASQTAGAALSSQTNDYAAFASNMNADPIVIEMVIPQGFI